MDILAGILELIALWLVGNKNKYAFCLFILCNIAWIYVAIYSKVYGLLLISIPAIVVNTRNYLKWKEKKF